MLRRQFARFVLVAILAAGTLGCAAYKVARLPGATHGSTEESSRIQTVYVGASARAVLRNGDKLSGEVTAVTDTSVTFGRAGNYDLVERTVTIAELDVLEIESQSGAPSSTLAVVVGIAMALTGLVLLFPPSFGSN